MSTVCKNCHNPLIGKYCAQCGQKADTERITWHYLVHEIPHSVLHVDKGIFFTMRELFLRPAATLREYMEGKRVRHFKPLAYVIILTALSTFVSHLGERLLAANGRNTTSLVLEPTAINRLLVSSHHFFDKYPSIFYFLMIPVISLTTWLFFRRGKYNFWENVIMNTYLTAQFNLLLIMATLVQVVKGGALSYTPFLVVYFTYLAIVYSLFFKTGYSAPWVHTLRIIALIAVICFVYITGLSLAGMMTPWWGA